MCSQSIEDSVYNNLFVYKIVLIIVIEWSRHKGGIFIKISVVESVECIIEKSK